MTSCASSICKIPTISRARQPEVMIVNLRRQLICGLYLYLCPSVMHVLPGDQIGKTIDTLPVICRIEVVERIMDCVTQVFVARGIIIFKSKAGFPCQLFE